MPQRSNTNTCRYTVAKIFRFTEIYVHAHTHLHTDTQERSPDGQADAKKIFRSTDLHTDMHLDKHMREYVHMHGPFIDKLSRFPSAFRFHKAESTWNRVTVICCRELSQAHIIQTQAHINMFASFTKMPL